VKELTLHSKSSIDLINTILQSFSNLESLHFVQNRVANGAFVYQEGMQHQKLKKLQIGEWNGKINHKFAKLFGSCTKMEEFSAMSALNKGSLTEIFTLQPNLKSIEILCLIFRWKNSSSCFLLEIEDTPISYVTQTDFAAIKENGKKLEKFKCNSCIFDDEISPEKLQGEQQRR
jgi:hypothetical protein